MKHILQYQACFRKRNYMAHIFKMPVRSLELELSSHIISYHIISNL